MRNITFVWPQEPFLPQGLFKHYVYLGETAQYARQFGKVGIYDLSVKQETRNTIVNIAQESDLIFIPVEAYTAKNAAILSSLFRQNGKAIRVAYGTIASVNPKVLEPYFDIVLSKGNWEQAIKRLIKKPQEFASILDGKTYNCFYPIDGTEWTYPPLDLLPMDDYLKVHPNQLEFRVQRGCTYDCVFCGEKYRVPERKIYHRDPKDIDNFIKKNPNFFYYLDATTFTQNKEWAIETAKVMGNNNIKWRTVTRADKIDKKIAKALGNNGCIKIGFGVETFSQDIQRKIKKPVSFEIVKQASKYLIEAHVIPRAFLIIGLPGQTAEDILETQNLIKKLGIEYRWKEYISFAKIADLKNINDFAEFERNRFPKHKISGLSNIDYAKLLSKER